MLSVFTIWMEFFLGGLAALSGVLGFYEDTVVYGVSWRSGSISMVILDTSRNALCAQRRIECATESGCGLVLV